MNHYATIRAALELLEWRVLESERNNQPIVATRRQLDDALSALAELERAASEVVAWIIGKPTHGHDIGRYLVWNAGHIPHSVGGAAEPLYAAPPIPPAVASAPPVPAVVVTDEMCEQVYKKWQESEPYAGPIWAALAREMLELWQAELGPALGLVTREEMAAQVEAAYREGGFAGREGGEFNYRWATSNARKLVNGKCGGFVTLSNGGGK